MHVLDFLAGLDNKHSEDIVKFEYRLLCSGSLYNGNVTTADWRKSDATRFLLRKPFELFVCSHPFDEYPQELSLSFKTGSLLTNGISYYDFEIVQDLAALLSLFCRRLITVTTKVREIHPNHHGSEVDPFLDWPIGLVSSLRILNWKYQPAEVVYRGRDIEKINDYNPPPLAILPDDFQDFFATLSELPQAESFILSARLYALALENIMDDVDIAYQLLISSIETLANDALKSFTPTEPEMVEAKKAVVKLATEFGLPENKARKLATEACKDIPWSRRKFIKFVCDYTDESVWTKDELFTIPSDFLPKKEKFKSALSEIYSMRGKATHRGRPYPSSARVGTGSTIPNEAMLDIMKPDGSNSVFPPVAWFERVTNYSLCGFLRQYMKAADKKKVS
jgi:hypothetical protein